ncbi:MAG: 30S ribosomal protein S16 [Phycisphaerales bacterium]|jgi:small subunit ribosomal protein S16|nr:30S ribosomal protein S16 [Phycisphaerales bacterium]
MVRLRFQRFGRTHRPFYRLAAVDGRKRRDGAVLENLGWYNPVSKDPAQRLSFNNDRIKHWLSVGAQPSETVRDMLGELDLLTPRMKAEWEADRTHSRKRVEAKKAAAAPAE